MAIREWATELQPNTWTEHAETPGVWTYWTGCKGALTGIEFGAHGDERAALIGGMALMLATGGPHVPEALIGTLSPLEEVLLRQAVAAFRLQGLELVKGAVRLVVSNPEAVQARDRSVGEANFNRYVRRLSAEELQDPNLPPVARRAQTLLKYFEECDAVLSLHEYLQATSFAACDRRSLPVARRLGSEIVVYGWRENRVAEGAVDDFMDSLDKIGVTIELGDKRRPTDNIDLAVGTIIDFLAIQENIVGHDPQPPSDQPPRLIKVLRTIQRTEPDWRLGEAFGPFHPLTANQLIATQGSQEHWANEGEVVIFCNPAPKMNAEGCTLGKYEDWSALRLL